MKYKLIYILAIVYSNLAMSAIQLSSTRAIYNETDRSVSINVINKSEKPHLVQTWIESSEGIMEDAPFIIVPPVARVERDEGQVYRIYRTEDKITGDSEKIYWINFLDIPPRSKENDNDNIMQFAIRTRIKLFYRPSEIDSLKKDFAKDTSWRSIKKTSGETVLTCFNNSLLNYSISSFRLSEDRIYRVGGVCPAQGSNDFNLGVVDKHLSFNDLSVDVVNDYGGIDKYHVNIN